ncbi:DUF6519 domain-containing protein [uncultured Thiodictyon sp.]|uniref:DUF6519 domain-containing protein n=1 Tax=uncultured Thiodictyon sp. TaxID=1846217 RepID=UPI0025E32236|nr:DUF6519 domain-containing protein [uncultured Thiodictyon sp.]
MGSDRARISYNPARQYREVVSQQGRVTLEADVNEAQRLGSEALRRQTLDVVGTCGTPDDGYAVVLAGGADFGIGPGTLYLGGWRLCLGQPIAYLSQPDWLDWSTDPHWADPAAWTGNAAVLLLCREQEVTAVEDPALREVALGGPDTAARTRLLQRVILAPTKSAHCANAVADIDSFWKGQGLSCDPATGELCSASRLKVTVLSTAPADSPCDPPAQSGYLGADNQLIRVQITAFDSATGQGRLLWGFNNAATIFPCTTPDPSTLRLTARPLGTDQTPRTGQAVQVLRAAADLGEGAVAAGLCGVVATLEAPYQPESQRVALPSGLPDDYAATPGSAPLFLRLWEAELAFKLDDPVELAGTGLAVTLSAAGGTALHIGDFWCVAARPLTPNAVYPQRLLSEPQPPDGPRQWACPLAILGKAGTDWTKLADCRLPFENLVALTAHTRHDPSVYYKDDAGTEQPLHAGDSLSITTLARGLRLALPQPVVAASVNDAALFVTAEVPVLARALFEEREISDLLYSGNLSYEVPRTDLRATMLVGYQPVVMAATVGTNAQGDPTWQPVTETLIAFKHLVTRSFRNVDTETFNSSFDTFPDQSGNGDWRVNGDGVVIQLDQYQGVGRTSALHRKPIAAGLMTLRASMRPHLRGDFSDIGVVFNYNSDADYYFIAPTYDLLHGQITVYYGTPQSYMSGSVLNPNPARTLSHMALAVKQVMVGTRQQLVVSYLFGFSDGTDIRQTVPSTALANLPARFAEGTRIGIASRYSAQYEHLELVYPQGSTPLIPLAPPRILTRLALKRALLKPQAPNPAGHGFDDTAFDTWFWLLPGHDRFGYEPAYYYEYDPWFSGIGSNLL